MLDFRLSHLIKKLPTVLSVLGVAFEIVKKDRLLEYPHLYMLKRSVLTVNVCPVLLMKGGIPKKAKQQY